MAEFVFGSLISLVPRFGSSGLVLLIVVVTLSAIIGFPRDLQGAEVVIHVTATIDQLNGDTASVPTTMAVGDTITTRYIFDAANFTSNQTAALGSHELTLGDAVLESHNSASLVLNTGLFLPPVDPPDTLLIGCSSVTDVFPACNTNRFQENENLIWDPTLTLLAQPGSLETLADVRSLSSLSSVGATGTLLIDISELDVDTASLERLLTVRATITELTVVPEPTAIRLFLVAIAVASARIRRRF
jgi:hypothetical protein